MATARGHRGINSRGAAAKSHAGPAAAAAAVKTALEQAAGRGGGGGSNDNKCCTRAPEAEEYCVHQWHQLYLMQISQETINQEQGPMARMAMILMKEWVTNNSRPPRGA